MKKVGDMKLYSFDEIQDEIIGAKGTPERDSYEQELQEELQSRRVCNTPSSAPGHSRDF